MPGMRLVALVSVSLLAVLPAVALDSAPMPEPSAPESAELRAEIDRLQSRLDRLEAAQAALPRSLHAFELPVRLEFAGGACR